MSQSLGLLMAWARRDIQQNGTRQNDSQQNDRQGNDRHKNNKTNVIR